MSNFPWEAGFKVPEPTATEEVEQQKKPRGLDRLHPDSTKLDLSSRPSGRMPDPNSAVSQRIAKKTSENLTPMEEVRVMIFVNHYLKTFDPVASYVEAGGSEASPQLGYQMLRWPATQLLLRKALDAITEEELLDRKGIIMGLLTEAHHHGADASHGARVRSWMGLARIARMDVQVTENTHTHRGGVMVIPMTKESETIDGWAQEVTEQQRALKDEVRK